MQYPSLARDIDVRATIDQDMRRGALKGGAWDLAVDKAHTEWMQEVVSKIGWPTISKVGKHASEMAWLLVQHADHNVQFQSNCLALMQAEPPEEVERWQIAMLTDRICSNRREPQRYGTQFYQKGRKHIPRPIEDEVHVDERRAQMGLGTLAEGITSMYRSYGIPGE